MNEQLTTLLALLDLEPIGDDVFRSVASPEDPRNGVFGGLTAGQAIAAAGRTVDAQCVHSFHAYFLKFGDPSVPILFRVTRIRDGRAFSTRQVTAHQGDLELLHLLVSFHTPGLSYEHQRPMPEAPDPEDLPSLDELLDAGADRIFPAARIWAEERRAIDMRYSVAPIFLGGSVGSEPCLAWFRVQGDVGDEPLLHRCLITYATHISLNDNALRPHGHKGPLGRVVTTSVDHSIWFHTEARADEWLLYAMESPRASNGRGFSRGSIFRRDGVHVASVAQESMMRPARRPSNPEQAT